LRETWLGYARSLVDGVSLRKAAAPNDIHLETSFRWRHRFLASAKSRKAGAVAGIVEADETFILKSAKGSRRIVGRAPRKRGGKARKPGLSTDEHNAILIARDRHGLTSDQMLLDLSAASIASHRARHRRQSRLRSFRQRGRHHTDGHDRRPRRARDRLLSHPERQRVRQPLRTVARPVEGVGSHHLPSYLDGGE
jgi:hypothetical protein